ncbi:Ig-like domain-containing protein [Chitinophaga nivalis]|uniref:Ig-like domain-containing protein n=1 Tax=Chitinophaga nivalis TaxID=2991709 RepID=A0ABT3IH11_9BACT|nr:Ig-like domain-containing protein [Chitinophaga nivalis]MCW3467073.1 Ig-like domain-containing protein [Chitinophaga nivalis]MCW3483236.1 Ig-like domain-containing protein [Chitinophaga nivalis]
MKTHLTRIICVTFMLLISIQMSGQVKSFSLGTTQTLLQQLKQPAAKVIQHQQVSGVQLQVSPSSTLFAKINVRKPEGSDSEQLIGEIAGVPQSSVYIRIAGKTLNGNIVFRQTKKAYKYYSDSNGNAYVKEVDINEVLCIDYVPGPDGAGNSTIKGTRAAIDPNLLKLESFPGANGCILLDFDGQYVSGTPWNNGNPINAQPSVLTDPQIQEAWELIAEDYKPFHVNVTTNETVFNTYAKNRRIRCIFTPTNTAAPGAGGVAYLESFSWNDDTPCWVFNSGVKGAGDAGTHEAGHTLGLNHDGRTSPSEAYYAGHGNWAPIMGVSYYKPVGQWSKGEYANANNKENDLAIITSALYGLGYRTDDYGNTTSTASPLTISGTGTVNTTGLIERTGDIDAFSFSTAGGNVTININPAPRHPDLDVLATLYNSSGTVVTTANPADLAATITTNLAAGNYVLTITGTGAGNPSTDGYSNYGSLGPYTITGTIPRGNGNQSPVVSITAPTTGSSYTAPANIAIQATASDPDGTIASVEFLNGSTSLSTVSVAPYNFNWNNVPVGSYTLTAVATDDKGAKTTSAPVTVTVTTTGGNQSPTVSITSPANNATFTAPATVTIQADAADPDGSVYSVQFFYGSSSLGTAYTAPYSVTWNNAPAGDYTLTAKATDNQGAITTSSPVAIKVTSGGGTCAGVAAYQTYPKIYYKGDRAVYNNTLYECLVDGIYNVTPGTAWWWWNSLGPCSGSTVANASKALADSHQDKLFVYPNPVTGAELLLQVSGEHGEQLLIEVRDIKGNQAILRQTQVITDKGATQNIRIDVSKVPAGTWLISTTNQRTGKVRTTKIIRL